MQDGIFKAKAQGFHGVLTVTTTIKDNKIENVKANGIAPYTVGELSANRMIERINNSKSVDVDAITGATFSSSAILKAAKKGVEVSEGKMTSEEAEDIKTDPHSEISVPKYSQPIDKRVYQSDVNFKDEYDVIIAGSGASGLSAAIEAARNGAKTILFEKAGMPGGTTNYSQGIIQASGTKWQKKFTKYQDDNPQKHLAEYMQTGEGHVNEELLDDFTKDAANTIDWLSDLGLKWQDVYGHKVIPYENKENFADRIHVYEHGGVNGAGVVMITKMLKAAEDAGVKIVYDTPVVQLISKSANDNEVVGVIVEYKNKRLAYKANKGVVLATASIDHNEKLAKRLDPWQYRDIKKHTLLNSKYDTGDGIIMGMAQGAGLAGVSGAMDADFKFAAGFSDEITTFPMFYVNGLGNRYVNEDTTYGYLTRANYEQETNLGKATWMIFGKNSIGQGAMPYKSEDDMKKDMDGGYLVKADTIESLARKINVNIENLTNTLNVWNKYASESRDPQFGRTEGVEILQAPFYAYQNRDMNIGSIAGLNVNVNLEVLDNLDRPIKGLYAAGQNAGGWIGEYYPGSGTALGGSLHQGRRVGKELAQK